MGEDSGPVEGAVVLGEVQPALEAVRALAADAKPDDVRRAAQDIEPVKWQLKDASSAQGHRDVSPAGRSSTVQNSVSRSIILMLRLAE